MEQWLLWSIGGFVLVIAEVVTGTFYLLVIGDRRLRRRRWSRGSAATSSCRRSLGGAVAIGGVVFVHHWHARNRGGKPGEGNFLDRGQAVVLEGWTDEAARIARVKYRGTSWDARLAAGADHPAPGRHALHRRAGGQHARRRGRSARRLNLDHQSDNEGEAIPMFVKTVIAVILTIAAATLTHSTTATIATFVVAMLVVLLFEGVRIVPQQQRLGDRAARQVPSRARAGPRT